MDWISRYARVAMSQPARMIPSQLSPPTSLQCAEHSKPGETWRQTAQRGLREELGVEVDEDALEMVRDRHINRLTSATIADFEFVVDFALKFDGEVKADGVEVKEVVWVTADELHRHRQTNPAQFTPWFLSELQHFEQLSSMPQSNIFDVFATLWVDQAYSTQTSIPLIQRWMPLNHSFANQFNSKPNGFR